MSDHVWTRRSEELASPEAVRSIGSKARFLSVLMQQGCRVPAFVAVPNTTVEALFSHGEFNPAVADEIVREAVTGVNAARYAVRSAALIEDQAHSSMAGQFKTVINLSQEELSRGMKEVIEQAVEKLEGDLSKFSLIIQAYIEADLSGVLFTRHPEGLRQMLIEYHAGRGEELVSGQIQPKSLEIYWDAISTTKDLPQLPRAIELAKKFEALLGHPQDMEWCIKKGEWFFLQVRPVTTISRDQYEGIQFLETYLPSSRPFYYAQTEISEICPRPVPCMLDLLKQIYAKGGPVERVYRQYEIAYQERDFLRIIGNQLYVDREEEIKTLFPNYTYLSPSSLGKPTMVGLKGFLTSIRQQGSFQKLGERSVEALEEQLHALLLSAPVHGSFTERLTLFLERYQVIFEINLLAEHAVKRAQTQEPTFSLTHASVDASTPSNSSLLKALPIHQWKGNSLDIADEHPFVPALFSSSVSSPKPSVQRAYHLTRLREEGRWLTVKEINELRTCLQDTAMSLDEVYFSTLNELRQQTIDAHLCLERKTDYQSFHRFSFPGELSRFFSSQANDQLVCLSKGQATGRLVTKEEIHQVTGAKIFVTDILTPDLVQYFSQIQGIVTKRGGVLSHLAILAREQGLPVLSNVDLRRLHLTLGQPVEMDAEKKRLTLRVDDSLSRAPEG